VTTLQIQIARPAHGCAATVDSGQNGGGSVRLSTRACWTLVQVWNFMFLCSIRAGKGCFYFPAQNAGMTPAFA
jgi:hypothetical protein